MSAKNIKCSVDGRLFATKAALKQHRDAAHPNAAPGPRRRGSAGGQKGPKKPRPSRTGMSLSEASLCASGTDLVGSITVSDSDGSGKILVVWDINPMTLANTRLYHLASTFARWRPKKIVFSAHPGMGVLTPGSYCMGWVGDPSFSLGDASTRLQRIMTLSPSVLASFGTPRQLVIPVDTTQKWYFCQGSDEKETTHGQIIAVLAGLVGGKNLSINFRVDWTIEFSSAEVPLSSTSSETYPDPQYLPCFTDSVSDWAGGAKLTFKHKDGGTVVPWIGARSDYVYKPAPGVVVPYKKADGTMGTVGFFAIIGGIYPTGMACFDSEANARAYVKNKDFSKALDYKGDGDYTTPLLPTLTGKEVEDTLLDLRLSTLRIREDISRRAKEQLEAVKPPALSFRGGRSDLSPKFSLGVARVSLDSQYADPAQPHVFLSKPPSTSGGTSFHLQYRHEDDIDEVVPDNSGEF